MAMAMSLCLAGRLSPSAVAAQGTRAMRSTKTTQAEAHGSPNRSFHPLAQCTQCSLQSTVWKSQEVGRSLQRSTIWSEIRRMPKQQCRGVVSASLAGPGSVEVAASLFQLATAFVVPFYTVMILAPRWEWTNKLMRSEIPYFVLGAGYIYLLCLSWTPETFSLMFSSKYWLPELPGITRMFSSTLTVASAWLHLLAADLFAGRQVFLDGVKHNVETRHSLVLCLMMCPIGIFSHLVTKSATLFMRKLSQDDEQAKMMKRT